MDEIDETIVPRYYPIAIKLLERREREIIDCMNRMLSHTTSYKTTKNQTEYLALIQQLKLTKNEIWFLKNL